MTLERKRLGRVGEQLAGQYLVNKGYRILFRNFRIRLGEIDLICEKDSMIVFIEVRSKSSNRFGTGMESVQYQKQHRIRQVAQSFLIQKKWSHRLIRFDVIDVYYGSEPVVTHIENAF